MLGECINWLVLSGMMCGTLQLCGLHWQSEVVGTENRVTSSLPFPLLVTSNWQLIIIIIIIYIVIIVINIIIITGYSPN